MRDRLVFGSPDHSVRRRRADSADELADAQVAKAQAAAASRGGPLSASGLATLQRSAGNQAVAGLVVQRDSYAYGAGNSIPHIHVYSGGDCHLKIMDGSKVKRIDLVQGGKKYGDKVAEAFDLARATGNTTLVNAIKDLVRGVPFA